jgi:TolB protein
MAIPWKRSVAGPLAALMLLTQGACSDSVAPVADGDDEVQEQILFVRGDDAGDIFRMRLNGTDVENVTESPSRYSALRLSPDGTKVLFYSDRESCYDVWTMDVDGTELRQLTGVDTNERCNYAPQWSPDGSKIAFYSSRNVTLGLGWEAYVMNADGTGVVEVGGNPSTDNGTNTDMVHGWSPDGRVVLLSDRDGTKRTYLVNPDGTGLDHFADGYVMPYWSPDGSEFVIQVEAVEDDMDLYVVGSDGGDALNVTSDPGWDAVSRWSPTPWSPDGEMLAFVSTRTGNWDIYTVNADGSGLKNVTDHPAFDQSLHWSPGGTRFLFSSDRSGNREIYVANADGTGVVKLTDDPAQDDKAIWVPGG